MDTELRELQRAFEETGSLEDELAWLQALRREGALDDERLRFAAMLGNEACLEITGLERLDAVNERARFDLALAYGLIGDEAGEDLRALGEDDLRTSLALRCAAAAGREFLGEQELRTEGPRETRAMLGALDALVLCGRTRALEVFVQESNPREARGREALIHSWLRPKKRRNELDGLYAAIVGFSLSGNGCMFGMLGISSGAPRRVVANQQSFGISEAKLKPEDALRPWQATQRELVPWLLGRGDPVLERMLRRPPPEKNRRPKPCEVPAEARLLDAPSSDWQPTTLRAASSSHLVIDALPAHPEDGAPVALAFQLQGFPRPVCAITRATSRRVEDRPAHQLLWTEPAAWRYLAMWWAQSKQKPL